MKNKTKKFVSLKPGQKFQFTISGTMFIKIFECQCRRNAVCLEDGTIVNVDPNAEIFPILATKN